ncbi:hypothetical protein BDV06DRAFT_196155 [Aspergillus oleicola]
MRSILRIYPSSTDESGSHVPFPLESAPLAAAQSLKSEQHRLTALLCNPRSRSRPFALFRLFCPLCGAENSKHYCRSIYSALETDWVVLPLHYSRYHPTGHNPWFGSQDEPCLSPRIQGSFQKNSLLGSSPAPALGPKGQESSLLRLFQSLFALW